jgi:4-hydroxy-tetrahydrodipicolinate synthase
MTEHATSRRFSGLSAFPLTPTDAAGHLQTDVLGRFLENIQAAGADSIGLLGSTGGYAYLTREARQRAVRVAVECVGGKIPIIVGVGALRTDEAETLARDAKAAGADGLLLSPMSYAPLTDEEVFQHFSAVAAAGELPLCIYNNPSTTKFTFSHDLIARLARLPNVAAVKMPLPANGDFNGEMERLRAITPNGFATATAGIGAPPTPCWLAVTPGTAWSRVCCPLRLWLSPEPRKLATVQRCYASTKPSNRSGTSSKHSAVFG